LAGLAGTMKISAPMAAAASARMAERKIMDRISPKPERLRPQ
jgi:hypothetical protein